MATELQKQTSEALTFVNQPGEFLTQLERLLVTLQDAYRSKLSDAEQQLWILTLTEGEEKFSMEEVHRAVTEMIKNPPLFEVPGPDGPITQKWRGMPKLPDLIETMLDLRSKRAREERTERQEREQEEWRELEKRRMEHPEEFFGMGDLAKLIQPGFAAMPHVSVASTGGVDKYGGPEVEPVSPILANDDLARQRVQQMKADLARHQEKAGK